MTKSETDLAARRLHLTWVLPEPSLAGGIRAVRELAEAMEARGHRCVFVHPPVDTSWPPPWKPRRFLRRIAFEWSHRDRPAHHLVETTIAVTNSSGAIVTEEDVPHADFIIATWWKTREWIESFPLDRGKKAYFIQHFETHSGGDEQRVLATYRLPSVKFAVAHWLKKKIQDDFGDDSVQVVPNGFDRSIFSPAGRGEPERKTVGFMFNTRKWKGVSTALAAVELLRKRFPNLRVLSFGDEALSSEARAAGVEYFRSPEQTRIADLYRSATVWLVPSLIEGFGLPGIEAAGCGTPLVATYSGGPEDYVRVGKNGYLVQPEDPEALADRAAAILGASSEKWRELSQGSLEVADEFQWPKSAEILERHLLAQLPAESTSNGNREVGFG